MGPDMFCYRGGFRYYLPALVRLALSRPDDRNAGPTYRSSCFTSLGTAKTIGGSVVVRLRNVVP